MKAISIYLVLLSALQISCNKTSERSESNRQTEIKEIIAFNRKKVQELEDKYKAVAGWDTLELFTYELQEIVAKGRYISFSGEIEDILRVDSTYVIKVSNDWNRNYLAELTIHTDQLLKFKEIRESNSYGLNGVFIFRADEVISLTVPKHKSNEYEEVYFYYEPLAVIKGQLFDFYFDTNQIDK